MNQVNSNPLSNSHLGRVFQGSLLFLLVLTSWFLPSPTRAVSDSYYEVNMTAPTKAGQLEFVCKQKNKINNMKWTTTVTIDVTADMTAEEKMQALADAINQATSVGQGAAGASLVGATFVSNPGHISVAPLNSDNPFTDLRVTDDGTGQKINLKKVTDISAPASVSDGTVVFFGEPLGRSATGAPSLLWLGTNRFHASITIQPGDGWDTLEEQILLELGVHGVSVTSPAEGVFLFRLNQGDDDNLLIAGSDDVGLEFSTSVR